MANKQSEIDIFYERFDMRELPLISVVIPVYNAEKTIKDTLRSVLSQSYSNIEVICINDGSTDKSLNILEHIAKYDNRVVVYTQKNQGPARARNQALDIARGKYVSFVDADDVMDIDAYKKLVFIAESENADIVVFGGKASPEQNVPQWIQSRLSSTDAVYEGRMAVQSALFHEPSSRPFLWLHFIKREIIENNHLRMDESLDLGEDQVFQFEYFVCADKVVFTKDKCYMYFWDNSGSLMGKYNLMPSEKICKHFAIIRKVLQEWHDSNREDPFGDLVSWAVDFVYWDIKRFPKYKQVELSKELLRILDTFDEDIYMCNKDTIDKAKEIKRFAQINANEEIMLKESIDDLKQKINSVEKQIDDTVNSRAFKLGRLLTPKSKRLHQSDYKRRQEKKN